jgi:hypothetical protein
MTAAHTPEEESVYNLIPPPPVVLPKPPMYKSGVSSMKAATNITWGLKALPNHRHIWEAAST